MNENRKALEVVAYLKHRNVYPKFLRQTFILCDHIDTFCDKGSKRINLHHSILKTGIRKMKDKIRNKEKIVTGNTPSILHFIIINEVGE